MGSTSIRVEPVLTDRCVNASTDSFSDLYKTELLYHKGPWRSVEWAALN